MSDIFAGIGAAVDTASGIAGFTNDIYNAFTRRSRQKHQEGREDTAIQRRVADLRAAGLSPTLAAGSAAESSAPVSPERIGPTDIQSKAISQRLLQSELEGRMADIASKNASADAAKAQAELTRAQIPYVGRDINIREDAQTLAEKAQLDAHTLGVDRLELDRAVADANILESRDRVKSRELERSIQSWNLRFADKHDLPTGHVNSGLAGQLVQAFDLLAAWKEGADERHKFTWYDFYDILNALPDDIRSLFPDFGQRRPAGVHPAPDANERTWPETEPNFNARRW